MKDIPVLTPIPPNEIPGVNDMTIEYSSYQLPDYNAWIIELQATGVKLSEDPTADGIGKLNVQIARIDAQKTRAATIMTSAIANEATLNSMALRATAIYKKEFDARLPQSPVKDFSNKELREGACNTLLTYLKDLVDAIDGSLTYAKMITRAVAGELGKLDSTNKNISRQITVLQLQLEIGEIRRSGEQRSSWGDVEA